MKLILNTISSRIHNLNNLQEKCNTDQIEHRESITERSAIELVAMNLAKYCEHCMPDDREPVKA